MTDLIYDIKHVERINDAVVKFVVGIIDEHTLQVMEQRFPGQLVFDGGREFTLTFRAPIKEIADTAPDMWELLKEQHKDLVSKYLLLRLRGEI